MTYVVNMNPIFKDPARDQQKQTLIPQNARPEMVGPPYHSNGCWLFHDPQSTHTDQEKVEAVWGQISMFAQGISGFMGICAPSASKNPSGNHF